MTWQLDPAHTIIEFRAKHMMFTTVRGQFKSYEGTFHIDTDNPAASKVEGTIDVATLETGDEQRDAHLRSGDFFDVENYPKMSFRSTRVEPVGGNTYKVYGDMTIKDVTREVVFDVTNEGRGQDPWGGQRMGLSAETKINRKDFGLTWNVALETGGWLVGDEIKIEIQLQLVLEAEAEKEAVAVA